MKKALLLLLSLLLLVFPLASCKKDDAPAAETGNGGGTTDNGATGAWESVLPQKDFGGREVVILSLKGCTLLQGTAEDGDLISQALAERTDYVENRYKVAMSVFEVDDGKDYSTLYNSYSAGLQSYDMVAPHPTKFLATMMASGMMQDLESLEYIDTTQPWWNQSQVQNFNINGKLFFGVSDFNLNRRGFPVMLLNRTLYDQKYEENIYDVVFNGDWTMEKMAQLVSENYDDELEKPTYGYICHKNIAGFYYAAGQTLMVRDQDGNWTVDWDVETISNVVEKVYEIINGNQTLKTTWFNSNFATNEGWLAFTSKRALMFGFDLGGGFATLLRDLDFTTAFLPSPKLDKAQPNYYAINASGFTGIPNDAKDLECSALIMEAFNEHSYYHFREAYFDNYLAYTISKDPNDYKVLELILDNTVYELAYNLDSVGLTSGKGVGMMREIIIENAGTDVASYVQNNEETFKKAMEAVIADIY